MKNDGPVESYRFRLARFRAGEGKLGRPRTFEIGRERRVACSEEASLGGVGWGVRKCGGGGMGRALIWGATVVEFPDGRCVAAHTASSYSSSTSEGQSSLQDGEG